MRGVVTGKYIDPQICSDLTELPVAPQQLVSEFRRCLVAFRPIATLRPDTTSGTPVCCGVGGLHEEQRGSRECHDENGKTGRGRNQVHLSNETERDFHFEAVTGGPNVPGEAATSVVPIRNQVQRGSGNASPSPYGDVCARNKGDSCKMRSDKYAGRSRGENLVLTTILVNDGDNVDNRLGLKHVGNAMGGRAFDTSRGLALPKQLLLFSTSLKHGIHDKYG